MKLLQLPLLQRLVLSDALQKASSLLERRLASPSQRFWTQWQALEMQRDIALQRQGAEALYTWACSQSLPLVQGERVTFLYFGEGDQQVSLVGDWNGWNPEAEPLERLGQTSLFALERSFPFDARLGYQFVIDGAWGPDPRNLERQVIFGEHAVLRMPGFAPDPALAPGEVPRGAVETFRQHPAAPLEGKRDIYVYLPKGYDDASPRRYPVLYLMDGVENLERGRIPDLLDRLIYRGAIPPLLAVFIPNAGVLRNQEYTPYFPRPLNDDFRTFLTQTVVPLMDTRFKTVASREGRLILGQSFGATIAAYVAWHHPDLFACAAGQSGVYFWEPGTPDMLNLYAQGERRPIRLYLDSTMFRSEPPQSQAMVQVLREKGYPHVYIRRPAAHDYESWRFWIPDALRYWLYGSHRAGPQ